MARAIVDDANIIKADKDTAVKAAEALIYGELVAVPTETVYGLAADATNNLAVASIFEKKGRPFFNPLICHVASVEMADTLIEQNALSKQLMDSFWPGPLTLVLPALPNNGIADLVSANLPTLAVRMPANTTTRAIIEKLGKPIAAPSANKSGKISPTTANHVWEAFGNDIALIVDDGPTVEGLESTIIAVDGNKLTLLRPGTITKEDIETALSVTVADNTTTHIQAPGMMASHYAPDYPVFLNKLTGDTESFLIGFGDMSCDANLSEKGDLKEAAANLFSMLRIANDAQKKKIYIAPIPKEGLGLAINDRISRAAAPRPS